MKNVGIKESWVDAAQYVAVALFAFIFMRDAFEAFSVNALLFGLLACAALVPWPYRQLKKVTRFAPSLWVGWIAAFFFLILHAADTGDVVKEKQVVAAAKQANESRQRVAKARAEREVEWSATRQQVLANIDKALQDGNPQAAFALASTFFTVTKDPDLARRYNNANILLMKKDLEREKELLFDRKVKIYTTLSAEEPGYVEYASKQAEHQEVVAIKQKMEAAQVRHSQLRVAVDDQFSKFDGSHRKVEAAVKFRLNDPSSYEHVKTQHIVNPDSITVNADYRAKNKFKAVVRSSVTAEVDAAGNVLSLSMN